MNEDRDLRLGAAIEALPVPPRDDAFTSDLLVRLEEADAARSAPDAATPGPGRRLRRRWLLVAAAAAAAAVFAVMLLGPGRGILRPGSGGSVVGPLIGPEPAVARIIKSTLAVTGAARSIQGQLLVGSYRGGRFRLGQRIWFIVDQDGSVDLRAGRPTGETPAAFSAFQGWPDMRSARYVYDARARRETTLIRYTKTMTGTIERDGQSRTIHFSDQAFITTALGAGAPYNGTSDQFVPFFRLRAYLLQALDSRSPVVRDATVDGRPAWRIVTTMAAGQGPQTPIADVVSIVIDKRTYLPLRFSWHAPGGPVAQLRLTGLRIDAAQPADAFTIHLPSNTYVLDFGPGSFFYTGPGQHPVPFGDATAMRRLMQSAGDEPAFASWTPPGFVRSGATYGSSGSMEGDGVGGWRMTPGTVVFSFSYRRGFDAISVSLQPAPNGHGWQTINGKTYALHQGDPFLQLYGPAYRYIAAHTSNVVLHAGPFAGRVAHIVVDPSVMPHLWVTDQLFTATVSGDLSSADMARVVESLKTWPQSH